MMMFDVLNAATWGDMAKEKEKSFFDFEFITWMAWTWQTAAQATTALAMSNTMRLGLLLYTDYFVPFQLSGLLLLTGIVSAIVLTFDQRPKGKQQDIAQQVQANKKNRLKIINLKREAP